LLYISLLRNSGKPTGILLLEKSKAISITATTGDCHTRRNILSTQISMPAGSQ